MSFSDHWSTFAALILPKLLTYLRCRLCTAPKRMPTSLVHMSRLLSHITRVCTTLTVSSVMASLVWLSSSTLSLSLPPPHKICCPFYCAIRRRLLPKGFNDVFMHFFWRNSFLTENLITFLISSFSILQMCRTL